MYKIINKHGNKGKIKGEIINRIFNTIHQLFYSHESKII